MMNPTSLPDAIALTKALLACDSITPARGAVFDVLEAALLPLGFTVERFVEGDAPDGPVENLLATRGGTGTHFAFAGHLDVVPPGSGWTGDPFAPQERDGQLYGRGAPVTLIITGDEEGPATYGTQALMARMAERGVRPDLCLVGEPTSAARLGDTVKIGRRGSINIWIDVAGRQGHVAYPHLADNPIPKLVAILATIDAVVLDQGSAWFQPSNIEATDITVGNPATNVIPGHASARLSIRFNDAHRGADLIERVRTIAQAQAPDATVTGRVSGEAFLTEPGAFSTLIGDAIEARLGLRPELSTTGGTSDARFLSALCPVVEFGLLNATMHKLDEAVAIDDLVALSGVYADILARVAALGG
jgi:succinyl-diaminopimelate desuccinylase